MRLLQRCVIRPCLGQRKYPPIWRQISVGRHAVRAAPERAFCAEALPS
jgi:hypothetical protein